jgi:hypothetical protein
VVRHAVFMSLLCGCTILNAPDESRIRRVELCDNGIDDEGDELTDCNDPDCLSELECLVDMPLDREPPCAPLLPSLTLNDAFDRGELDLSRWVPFTDPFDPMLRGETLELISSGIRSAQEMHLGSSIPFELVIAGTIVDRDREPSGCRATVAFESADFPDQALLEIRLRLAAGDVTAACFFRGVPLEPLGGVTLSTGAPEISALRDPETHELLVQLEGRQVCRTPMDEVEPTVRLRVSSRSDLYTDCGLAVDSIDLNLRAQEPPEECEGLRRPLIPDDQCLPGPLGNVRPWEGRVARAGDGSYVMLTSADDLLVRATSSDGRHDWTLETDPVFASSLGLLRTGAMSFDPRGELRFWLTEGANERGRVLTGASSGGALSPQLGVLTLDSFSGTSIVKTPLAVAPHDGGWIGFFSALDGDDSDAIFAGLSRDGQRWSIQDEPVLSRSKEAGWDFRGVRSPAVFFTGDFYLMAYAATEFLGKPAIGLAVSRDGFEWVRHANNPVVVGEDDGFDVEGVEPRSIALEGDVIRIWYFARTNTPNPCLRPRADYKQIGLTELRGRPRP